MRSSNLPVLATLILLLGAGLGAAEKGTAGLERLAQQKPLVHKMDDGFRWGDAAGVTFPITAYQQDQGLDVTTDAGPVRIRTDLATGDEAPLAALLADLVAKAKAGAVTSTDQDPLLFNRSLLLEENLRGKGVFVCALGVLRQQAGVTVPDLKTLNQDLDESILAAQEVLRGMDLPDLARTTANGFLARLPRSEDEGAYDEYPASFARKLVCHGWLTQLFGDHPAGTRVTAAVVAIEQPHAQEIYTGEGVILQNLDNAFGKTGGGWLLTTPSGVRLVTKAMAPEYHFAIRNEQWQNLTRMVLDLDATATPLTAAPLLPHLLAVRCVRIDSRQANETIATWTRADGLQADAKAWRQAYPDSGRGVDDNAAQGIMPPHLVVADLWGDIEAIITAGGILRPPADDSMAESTRFIADAATLLPDAPHLDLVGEYLLRYVHDSPDPTRRWLLGLPNKSSDIHQTAHQTLATTAGGVCRGDCDDLSELYEHIVDAQGKTAHVISLPSHAATAWAEERQGVWHVFIMQTGPTLEFVDERLQNALASAYKSFGADETFDPNGLGLLLRFSGENTRSGWRLSYRIFSEPVYAATMIDVQRDWHFQTYLQGIKKMLTLIDGGDQDTANFRELAGLYNFTGQYAKATEYEQLALDRTAEEDSKLFMQVEMVQHLIKAKRLDDALKLTRAILAKLPGMERQIGAGAVHLGLQLVSALVEAKEYALATEALADTSLKLARYCITQLSMFIESDEFTEDRWRGSSKIGELRRVANIFSLSGRLLLDSQNLPRLATDAKLRDIAGLVQRDFDGLAFSNAEDEGMLMVTYGALGMYYLDVLGREAFLAQIEAAVPPTDATHDHQQRIGGLAQVPFDLPWIKVSPSFWAAQLARAVADKDTPIAPAEVKRITAGLTQAVAALKTLDLIHARLEQIILQTRMSLALLQEDAATVREILTFIKTQDDKRQRDDISQIIGDLARRMSDTWFDAVVAQWVTIVDYKPKYLWIAWRAALGEAHQKALRVAKIAAERFQDDPAFVEEYKFMQELFKGQ